MKYFILIILFFLLSSCTKDIVIKNTSINAESVPMYGKTPERNFNYDVNQGYDLELLWESNTHGNFGNTSFVAYDTTLITTTLSGRVTAFNLNSGKRIGELKYDGEIEQAALINNISLVFIVNELKEKYSKLVIYDFKNSREINSIRLSGKFNNELLSVGNNIFVVSDFGVFYSFSPIGNILWKKELGLEVHSNPAADSNFIYVASNCGNLLKVDLNNGEIIYNKKVSSGFQSGISISENNLFIGDNEGNIFSINKNHGELNWEFKTSGKIIATPAFDKNNVYVGNLKGDLYSINANNSKLDWIHKSNGLINSPCIVFEDIIIQPNLFMKMEILDKSGGRILNEINYDSRVRTAPIFYKDKLLIGVDKGEIYCYYLHKN